jgi:hypothetical protein
MPVDFLLREFLRLFDFQKDVLDQSSYSFMKVLKKFDSNVVKLQQKQLAKDLNRMDFALAVVLRNETNLALDVQLRKNNDVSTKDDFFGMT